MFSRKILSQKLQNPSFVLHWRQIPVEESSTWLRLWGCSIEFSEVVYAQYCWQVFARNIWWALLKLCSIRLASCIQHWVKIIYSFCVGKYHKAQFPNEKQLSAFEMNNSHSTGDLFRLFPRYPVLNLHFKHVTYTGGSEGNVSYFFCGNYNG